MSDPTVVVVESGDSEQAEAAEEVAEAIEQVQDETEAMLLGAVLARVDALEQKLQFHDDLITLHSHDGFAERSDVAECEDRICSKIDSLMPAAEEIPEETVVPEVTPAVEEETTSSDEPPKSRRKNKSIADRYYGR